MPKLSICPFSFGIFVGTAVIATLLLRRAKQTQSNDKKTDKPLQVVFVLGGPGSGKGTQCELLTQRLKSQKWVHLSAGDLLRAERQKADSSELGALIQSKIAAGQLVPSSVTCQLIQNAMQQYNQQQGVTRFLIDGYPRGMENKTVWEDQVTNAVVEFVLFLECPEEVMTGRLLERGKTSGREDDADLDVIRKRLNTFQKETAPIVQAYEEQGRVVRVQADRPVEDVYQEVESAFANL